MRSGRKSPIIDTPESERRIPCHTFARRSSSERQRATRRRGTGGWQQRRAKAVALVQPRAAHAGYADHQYAEIGEAVTLHRTPRCPLTYRQTRLFDWRTSVAGDTAGQKAADFSPIWS